MEKHCVNDNPIKEPEPGSSYQIVPRWIDASGRTRTWTLLSPAGDRIADTTTKHGARNLLYLFNRAQGITWEHLTDTDLRMRESFTP